MPVATADGITPGSPPRRRHGAAAALLLAIAALRMLLVVAPTPMYGYANNYDFVRVSAWFDLWPLAPSGRTSFDPLEQHPRAPLRCYRVDHATTSDIRYPTAELAFVWLALRVNDGWRALTGPRVCELDLRVLGLVRTAILLGAAALVTLAFWRRSPGAGVGSALIAATVLSDPAVTLLFNTLYSEFSTILFAYLSAATIVYAIGFARFGLRVGVVLGATLLGLATTKAQYAGLALVLLAVLASCAALRRVRGGGAGARAATVGIAGACAIAGVLAYRHAGAGTGYGWSMRMAAATDTYFGAFLALHADPARGVALLGLPARCAAYAGRTWYDEGMQPPPCPEVADVSRVRLLRLLADDPALGVRLARRALPLLQPLVVRFYGQVEGEDLGQADVRPRSAFLSASRVVEALPPAVFAALIALTLVAGAIGALRIATDGSSQRTLALPALVLVLAVVEAYAFASSLAGDGFVDLARHALPGQLALLVCAPASVLLLARSTLRRRGDESGRSA